MGNSETERIRGVLDLSRHPTRARHPTRHTGPLSARDAGVLPCETSVAASVGRRVLPSAIVTRAHRARPATRRHLPPQRPGPPYGEYCSRCRGGFPGHVMSREIAWERLFPTTHHPCQYYSAINPGTYETDLLSAFPSMCNRIPSLPRAIQRGTAGGSLPDRLAEDRREFPRGEHGYHTT